MGLSVQVANFVRAINWCSSLSQRKCGEGKMVFLPKDICLCHSDRKSWWINQPGKKKGGGGVRKLMAKEKTMRILYMSGLCLPFHKQTSSYFCVFYLDILFLSLSTVWHLDFKKDWIHGKVSHMIYLERVEFLLLKFRNVWKVIKGATEMVNAIFSLKKEWKETHRGKKIVILTKY